MLILTAASVNGTGHSTGPIRMPSVRPHIQASTAASPGSVGATD
jgi:hypothetical protein